MRRFGLLILLSMCAAYAFARNESVAAISFNPSRMGAYTHLKAVSQATLVGGVDATANNAEVNIKSNGTVTLTDTNKDAHTCANNSCNGDADGGNLNRIVTIQPKVPNCGSECPTANMTKAVMKKAYSSPVANDYAISTVDPFNNDPANKGTNVTLKGGTLTATYDSYIHSFAQNNSVKKLTVAADQLTIENPYHVSDTFKMGNITINNTGTCSGTGGKCVGYEFKPRVATTGTYNVLTVKVK